MKISVLDQSPILSGQAPREALAQSIELARQAERLGYHRFWLAEHHAIGALADPCPEILAARIASATDRIRVGTGGVLLPYYSPLKVAESFRMLWELFPDRIDLGIGRAPGGDMRTAQAVMGGRYGGADRFPEQVMELAGFLDGTLPAGHPFARVRVQPEGEGAPGIWLLGSSDYSGALAAQLGLNFAFAHFINAEGGDRVMVDYKARFQPGREARPHGVVCVFVVCADETERAEWLMQAIDLRRLQMALGEDGPIPTVEQAIERARAYGPLERDYIASQRPRAIVGDPVQVRDGLTALAERYQADELMVLTITSDFESRLRSYELLAEAFGLSNGGEAQSAFAEAVVTD